MVRKSLVGILIFTAWSGAIASAVAGIEDPCTSYATIRAQEQVSMIVTPVGTGTPISSVYGFMGDPVVDATIDLWVRDGAEQPVHLFPASDLWLETESQGMILCAGGSMADQNTDVNGYTTFSRPMHAGGCGTGIVVMINGAPLCQPAFDVKVNSPDLNGDLGVDLTDVVLFAQRMFTTDYCADYHWDGQVNLSDLVILIQSMHQTCP